MTEEDALSSGSRFRDQIPVIERFLDRAVASLDPSALSEPELKELERYRLYRAADSLDEAIVALIQWGDRHPRPVTFWEEIAKAAELRWLVHPWATSLAESTRRMEYLVGLRNRIKGWDP